MASAIFGLDRLRRYTGGPQHVLERREKAVLGAGGGKRERCFGDKILAFQEKLQLERGDQIQTGLGLKIGDSITAEISDASAPSLAWGRTRIAQHGVQRRITVHRRNFEARLKVRDLPHFVHGPPGIVGDLFERRHGLAGAGPTQAAFQPPIEILQRHAARPGHADQVAPQ